jgi:hypothetical protein
LCLYGIDELLTYHYLAAEMFRVAADTVRPESYWQLSRPQQAELVWRHLFVERSPVSEAALGLVSSLQRLGLDPTERRLDALRRGFANHGAPEHIDRVLGLCGARTVIMTNNPMDDAERAHWDKGVTFDERFKAVLRLDAFVTDWESTARRLREDGTDAKADLSAATIDELRRYFDRWIARMRPLYLALSLPPEFRYPDSHVGGQVFEQAILRTAEDHGLPVALMIGVRRQVNPALRLAGDAVGRTDLAALANLCAAHPRLRFLVTVLARENQHELAVVARKFANLHIFGCWWFVNTASLTDEITRMRMELLGHSFTPQHSDARVLEQLIYKWSDARRMLTPVLTERYQRLAELGWPVTTANIEREVADFLGAGAMRFMGADLT